MFQKFSLSIYIIKWQRKKQTYKKSTPRNCNFSLSSLSLSSLEQARAVYFSLSECACENDICEEVGELEIFFILPLLLFDVFEKKNQKKKLEKKGRPKPRNHTKKEKKERRKLSLSLSLPFTHKNKRSTRAHAKGAQRSILPRQRERLSARERAFGPYLSTRSEDKREERVFASSSSSSLFSIFEIRKKKIPLKSKEK